MGSAFSGDICARGRHDGRAKNKEEEAAVAASPGTHYHHHFAIDVDHRPEVRARTCAFAVSRGGGLPPANRAP